MKSAFLSTFFIFLLFSNFANAESHEPNSKPKETREEINKRDNKIFRKSLEKTGSFIPPDATDVVPKTPYESFQKGFSDANDTTLNQFEKSEVWFGKCLNPLALDREPEPASLLVSPGQGKEKKSLRLLVRTAQVGKALDPSFGTKSPDALSDDQVASYHELRKEPLVGGLGTPADTFAVEHKAQNEKTSLHWESRIQREAPLPEEKPLFLYYAKKGTTAGGKPVLYYKQMDVGGRVLQACTFLIQRPVVTK